MFVMLSGASSSGKTTLAKALLPLLDPPAVLVEADSAFPAIHTSVDGDVEAPIVVFHRSLRTWADAGFTVVVDGSLPYGDGELRERCLDELRNHRTFVVGVTCSRGELCRREGERPDPRLQGWAESQTDDVNHGLALLVTVDTSAAGPLELAQRVAGSILATSETAELGVQEPEPRW